MQCVRAHKGSSWSLTFYMRASFIGYSEMKKELESWLFNKRDELWSTTCSGSFPFFLSFPALRPTPAVIWGLKVPAQSFLEWSFSGVLQVFRFKSRASVAAGEPLQRLIPWTECVYARIIEISSPNSELQKCWSVVVSQPVERWKFK